MEDAVQNAPTGLTQLSTQLGYSLQSSDLNSISNSLSSLSTTLTSLTTIIDQPDKIFDLMEGIRNIMNTVNNLESILSGLGERMLDYLFIVYLQTNYEKIYGILILLGIIEETDISASGTAPAFTLRKIHWDRFLKIINPSDLFTTVYGWNTSSFKNDLLLTTLEKTFRSFRIPAFLKIDSGTTSPKYLFTGLDMGLSQIGAKILPLSANPSGSTNAGLAIVPLGTINLNKSIDLGNGWSSSANINASLQVDYGVLITPGNVSFGLLPGSGGSVTASIDADIGIIKKNQNNGKIIFFGRSDGLRLQANSVGITAGIHSGSGELHLKISFDGLQLVISTSDADSFLHNILGDTEQTVDLSCAIIYSSKTGIHFEGNPGFEMTIPVNKTLSIVELDTLSIGISISDSGLNLIVDVSGNVTLGPLTATVDKVGIKLSLDKVETGQPQGLLGGLDMKFGFKPPNGLGLAIDAEIAKGGGYIFFDTDKGEYAGILEVAVGLPMEEVQVKIIGILDTKMPDGSEGFSFLLIVTVEFPAIQLGFGFTLNGLGGLAGINRTMSVDALRAGVKNHTLNDIMFPDDPIIPKAPQIISEVSAIFPVAQDRYVFAPMIKLGWEDILTAEIGVVLEIPDPVRIALLGIIKVVLPPDSDAEIIIINMDILGILDLEKKTFSLDGTLYDSRIVIFSLSGDMALRLGWGDSPTFALSVGGLNPHFQPPPNFPTLRRLTISVSYDKVNLSLDTYLAVTSNTLQFGAHLQLTASIAGFDIYGYFGFDVLIILSPFSFIADMKAVVEVKKGSLTLMGVDLELTLTGPTPWHGYGKATINILFISVTAHVDITVGDPAQSQPLSPVQVLSKLTDALQASRNWTGSMPGDLERAVTFASAPTDDKIILVHPLSNLAFHQKEVPLGLTITQFASGKPADADYFDIVDVKINNNPDITNQPAYDYFAMGQFQTMSDADKLSAPSFVQKRSGMTIGTTSVSNGTVSNLELGYETFIVDDLNIPATKLNAIYKMLLDKQFALGRCGAASLSAVRTTGAAKYAAPGNVISTSDPKYVIASTENLSIRNDLVNQNGTDWADANAKLKTHLSAHPEDFDKVQVMPVHEVVSLA